MECFNNNLQTYSGTHIAYQVVQSHGCSTVAGGFSYVSIQNYYVPVPKQLLNGLINCISRLFQDLSFVKRLLFEWLGGNH